MIAKIKSIFSKKHKNWTAGESDLQVVPAFISGGVQYYCMSQIANTYCERGLQTLSVWEEWEMRCSKEYLKVWIHKMDKILDNKETIKLNEIFDLKNDIKQRIEFIVPTSDIIWKLASVMFFDATENPYRCDEEYSKKKIAKWKQDNKVDAFFFDSLRNWMPLPSMSITDLAQCLAVVNVMGKERITEMLSSLSSQELSQGLLQELEYQKSLMSESKD